MLTIIPIIAVKIKHSHRNLTLRMKTNKVNKKFNIKKLLLAS